MNRSTAVSQTYRSAFKHRAVLNHSIAPFIAKLLRLAFSTVVVRWRTAALAGKFGFVFGKNGGDWLASSIKI